MARRAVEVIEPDQAEVDAHENELVRSEEEQALTKASFTWHDNEDGTTTGQFTLPTPAAGFLRKILDTMTAPRRMRAAVGQSFDARHRRGVAFAELLEHLPTDHLHHKTAATVVVTIDHHTLTGALKTAGLDTGAHHLRRRSTPPCLRRRTHPRRARRSLSRPRPRPRDQTLQQAQRIAAGLTHDTCAAEGCDRPYAWCWLHHRQPWSHGRTHRPRPSSPPVPLAPPTHPRPHLPTLPATRRHHPLPTTPTQADIGVASRTPDVGTSQ